MPTSSTTAAPRGTASSTSLGSSCPSASATGPMHDDQRGLVFLVAYPAQAASANQGKCWNWFKPDDQQRDQGEPSIIAGLTRQIMWDHAVDPERVYVAGLSAGGAAAAVMGPTYPDLYVEIGVHSGLACGVAQDLPSALAAMRQRGPPASASLNGSRRPVPTIVFHGDRDTTVSPVNGDQVIAKAKAGADLRTSVSRGQSEGGTAYTRTVQEREGGRPIFEQWVLHGTGHAWSGGSPAGSYTDLRGPDASREMLRFFFAHRRSSSPTDVQIRPGQPSRLEVSTTQRPRLSTTAGLCALFCLWWRRCGAMSSRSKAEHWAQELEAF